MVIVAGFFFDRSDFAAALLERENRVIPDGSGAPFRLTVYLAAAAVLFSSFIGFDSIAQAGGEAKNPGRSLPLAIGIAIVTVGTFYFLFTAAVYHAVPWNYIAAESATHDVTAPGLLGYLLPVGWTVAIVAGAAIALINDLPAMLLAVSRLMFAWAEDGIFPRRVAAVHERWRTPHVAIVLSGVMASVGILGSHLAGDFFLGVDILVTSMLVNFLLMCVSVLTLPYRNPALARNVRVLPSRKVTGTAGAVWCGSARWISGGSHPQGSLRASECMVFPLHTGMARRDGGGHRRLRAGTQKSETKRRRRRRHLLHTSAGVGSE